MDERFALEDTRNGYVFEFHADPIPPERIPAGASPSSLRSWAMIARPEIQNEPGVRGFCADGSGRICFTLGGSAVELVDGACHPDCTVLQ